MSTTTDQRKPIRIVAFNAKNVQTLKTVNVAAVRPNGPASEIKECLQLTAAQSVVQQTPTYMAAGAPGSTVLGIPTIFVNGYTTPN